MNRVKFFSLAGLIGLLLPMLASADTLVMRDGRRVEGELLGVRDGVINFVSAGGPFGRERVDINRSDVERIEFGSEPVNQGATRQNQGTTIIRRPAGMRERDVNVDSTHRWSDTGIDVRAGQNVYFVASGQVRWGPGRSNGAAGEQGSPYNATRPIPSRPAAALIGRVGEAADIVFIGDDKGPIQIRSNGRLYLGINDDNLQDNSGSLRVTVYY